MNQLKLILLTIFFFAQLICAESPISNLEKLENEIRNQEGELKQIGLNKIELSKKLDSANERIKHLEINRTNLNAELSKVKENLNNIVQELDRLAYQQEELKNYANFRYFQLYKKWRYNNSNFLRVKNQFEKNKLSLEKSLYYESFILKSDKKLLAEYIEGEFELAEKREQQEYLLNNQDELIKVLQQEYAKVEAEQITRRETLAQIALQEKEIKKKLIEYRAKALRFEVAFSSLLTGQSGAKGSLDKSFLAKAAENVSASKILIKYTGLNRSNYNFPISGTKLQHEFGRRKIDNFKDIVHNKGVEVLCPAKSNVFAIDGGSVAFAGKMPGYDNVVIINHGARDYSLYGKLNQILVKKDQEVDSNSIVGVVNPDESANDTNFYFEIRKAGKSVNPKFFLKNYPER